MGSCMTKQCKILVSSSTLSADSKGYEGGQISHLNISPNIQ